MAIRLAEEVKGQPGYKNWIPWQLAPDSDPEERFILVNSLDCGEEHPAGVLFDSAEDATRFLAE